MRRDDRAQRRQIAVVFGVIGISLAVVILGVVGALALQPGAWSGLGHALSDADLRRALWLSLVTSVAAGCAAIIIGAPLAWLLERERFPGRRLLAAIVDIPLVLPPLVLGLGLLLLAGAWLGGAVAHTTAAIVVAQVVAVTPFAVHRLRATLAGLDQRQEAVALTLGCTRWGALRRVVLPAARGGILEAGLLAWARALGEFGPVYLFAGATRGHTEVMPSAIFIELSTGRLATAAGLSLVLVAIAVSVIVILHVRHPLRASW